MKKTYKIIIGLSIIALGLLKYEIDSITFILLIVSTIILIIPIGLSYLINKILKKKDVSSRWRILSIIPILLVGYLVFNAFYPSEEFYINDFKEVTGVELPENAKFEYKVASFPDYFGDYISVSLIKVENKFYNELPSKLLEKRFSKNTEQVASAEMNKVKLKFKGRVIQKEYVLEQDEGVYYYVGFLSDKETLIIERLSW